MYTYIVLIIYLRTSFNTITNVSYMIRHPTSYIAQLLPQIHIEQLTNPRNDHVYCLAYGLCYVLRTYVYHSVGHELANLKVLSTACPH